MNHIILLNGPPQVGKDTFDKIVEDIIEEQKYVGFERMIYRGSFKFAEPLEDALAQWSGFPIKSPEFNQLRNEDKDKQVLHNDLTPRKFMQEFSTLMKKFWSDYIFGRICGEKVKKYLKDAPEDMIYIVTDCGFQKEFEAFVNTVLGSKFASMTRLHLVRVHRPEHTFDGDTREWIFTDKFNSIDVFNNGTLTEYSVKTVLPFLKSIVTKQEPHDD